MTPPRSAPDARGSAPDPRPEVPPYPAPYEEPWGRLLGDLQAVVATAGLKFREIWRRNREGDLSVPGFWPVSLAPLFWPVLFVLALVLVLGLILRLESAQHPAESRVQQRVQGAGQLGDESLRSHPVPSPNTPASEPQAWPPLQTLATKIQTPQTLPSPEPPLELDPLLALLTEDDSQACIASARPDPQASRLDLQIAAAYQALPPDGRQQLADHWLERSRDLGYEGLRLLDGNGTVLGQAARVGSGMVLLEPILQPQA